MVTRQRILFSLSMMVALLAIAIFALVFTARVSAMSEARVIPPEWRNGETYAFAIYRPAVGRIATAYFRFLTGEYEGRPIYEIRYTAKSERLTESGVTVVDAVTLEPYKSARKYKTSTGVSYVSIFYGQGKIVVRRKVGDEGQINETIVDFPGRVFDYDEVMWLIPQLDFSKDDRTHFALFTPVGDQVNLVVVRNMGDDTFEFHGNKFNATKFMYNLNLVTQYVWVGEVNGKRQVLKYDTGENVFYNLALLGPQAKPTKEKEVEKPKPEEEEKPQEEEEQPPPEEEGKVYF